MIVGSRAFGRNCKIQGYSRMQFGSVNRCSTETFWVRGGRSVKSAANYITLSRIFFAAILFFLPALTFPFHVIYVLAGFTDIVDGMIARRTGSVSEFGAKLDSIADIFFVVVCLVKILPVVELKVWLWIWIFIVAAIRGSNIVAGYVAQKKMVLLHTMANKITGFLLFFLPLVIGVVDENLIAVPIFVVATVAAAQEGSFIRNGQVE